MAISRTILINEDNLKESIGIKKNLDILSLSSLILSVQQRHLEPFLGTATYERLQQVVEDGENSGANYEFLVNVVYPLLASMVKYELTQELRANITNDGVVSGNGQTQQASAEDVRRNLQRDIDTINFYVERTILYIDDNEDDLPTIDDDGLYEYDSLYIFGDSFPIYGYSRNKSLDMDDVFGEGEARYRRFY